MGETFLRPVKGSAIPGLIVVGGRVALGASGAISGTPEVYGCSIVKTATKTGRYTITLNRPTVKLIGASVVIVGPDDAALTTTKGLCHVLRDDDLASDGTIELQFVQTNAGNADTEIQDSAAFRFMLFLIDTTLAA